jgi:hypothetical protein
MIDIRGSAPLKNAALPSFCAISLNWAMAEVCVAPTTWSRVFTTSIGVESHADPAPACKPTTRIGNVFSR